MMWMRYYTLHFSPFREHDPPSPRIGNFCVALNKIGENSQSIQSNKTKKTDIWFTNKHISKFGMKNTTAAKMSQKLLLYYHGALLFMCFYSPPYYYHAQSIVHGYGCHVNISNLPYSDRYFKFEMFKRGKPMDLILV